MRAVAIAAALSLGLGLGLACGSSKPAMRAPAGDPAAPALLAHVPADTPYVFAAFEAIPIGYWHKVATALRPAFFGLLRYASTADDADRTFLPVIDAIGEELRGGLTVANLERIGLSATPRYALYALDLTTVVLRLEIKDDAALLATIDRIAQRARLALPARTTRDGRQFWRLTPTPAIAVVVAAVDDQLVLAAGRAADVDAQLPSILGITRPRASMAGGAALAQIRDRYRVGPHLLGFVDSRRTADAIVRYAGAAASPACTREIARLAARVPRTVFGWRVTDRASGGSMVVELPADLVAELAALQTEVPAFDDVVGDGPQITVGAGLDLERGRGLARAGVQTLQRIATACDGKPDDDLARADALLAKPLPPPWGGLRGMVLAIHDIAFPPGGGAPSSLDLTVAVTGRAPGAILDLLAGLGIPPIARDGALHEVRGLPLPYALQAGTSAHALVVTTGPKGGALGAQVLAAGPGKRVPLFAINYDVAAWERVQRERDRRKDAEAGEEPLPPDVERSFDEANAKIYGRMRGAMTVEPAGLTTTWSTELR